MKRPSLPQYSSPENDFFHPPFKYAAEEAIERMGLVGKIALKGQFYSPTGPVDFVLYDLITNKIIAPVEIKRVPSSVRGQGRRQARDYWSNFGNQMQTKFYCVSNLEITELFRYEASKPRTASQKIEIPSFSAGNLASCNEEDFYENLINIVISILKIILGIDDYRYSLGLSQLQQSIFVAKDDYDRWHKLFMPACYEYILGASKSHHHLTNKTKKWKNAIFYAGNSNRIMQLGKEINFINIFSPPCPDYKTDCDAFDSLVLKEVHESGKYLGQGDDIAELVYEILAPTGQGIVETDPELANLLAIISKYALNRELEGSEIILDPASGSGRLLTSLTLSAYKDIKPTQIWANEIETRFAEPLSLRLGLAFASKLDKYNTPLITIKGVELLDKEDCKNVKVVVMNPPFISGVQSASKKKLLSQKIKQLTSKNSLLNQGQAAYELPFLELVWNLVKSQSIISCIFPTQHLYRCSKELKAFREFLIESFSLTHIVIYPRKGIFDKVIKQTVILVGNKGANPDSVEIMQIYNPIKDIDFDDFYNDIINKEMRSGDAFKINKIKSIDLFNCAEYGWRGFLTNENVEDFIENIFSGFDSLGELPRNKLRRGTVGNSGNTQLTVFSDKCSNDSLPWSKIPKEWLRPVINNTENMPKYLRPDNAPEMSFIPDSSSYYFGTQSNVIFNEIIDLYLSSFVPKKTKQTKNIKTKDMIFKDIKSNQNELPGGWVLVQRAARAKSQISILEDDNVLVSSNIIMIQLENHEARILLASWLLSVFGQCQLEYFSTPQEGMRKLEVGSLKKIKYPIFSNIPNEVKCKLIYLYDQTPQVVFKELRITESDELWAKTLYGVNGEDCLTQCFDFLHQLIDDRIGFG